MRILNANDIMARPAESFHSNYFAMYSSVFGGVVTDPRLMLVPMDDHLVHRGDGVFETIKFENNRIYLLKQHLDRLAYSARMIGMKPSWPHEDLTELIRQTIRAGGHAEGLVRVIIGRGPGSLGVNPHDCPALSLYILVHKLTPLFMDAHPAGARVVTSRIPVKPGLFANIKTCNYIPNALMKKEAADVGADFSLAFDERGFLAEGATENAGIVTSDRRLVLPTPQRILSGTTMVRVMELARGVRDLRGVDARDISADEIRAADELLIFGTTPDVTAAVEFDGRPVGDGTPGPIFRILSEALRRDIRDNYEHHTSA